MWPKPLNIHIRVKCCSSAQHQCKNIVLNVWPNGLKPIGAASPWGSNSYSLDLKLPNAFADQKKIVKFFHYVTSYFRFVSSPPNHINRPHRTCICYQTGKMETIRYINIFLRWEMTWRGWAGLGVAPAQLQPKPPPPSRWVTKQISAPQNLCNDNQNNHPRRNWILAI